MEKQDPSNNVIKFSDKKILKKSIDENQQKGDEKKNARVIAITSGKGGVGKTNIVANLGYTFMQSGKKVLIIDADLGLGNLDVLLGLTPKYNLSDVIFGDKSIFDVLVQGPGDMLILPASSGIQELTSLKREQREKIINELGLLMNSVDIMLIDTAAGISSNVIYFNVTAQEILVIVTPEPTSITDAYALMKVLSVKYSENHFKMLVNMAKNSVEAEDIFRQLDMVVKKFLDISIEYVGHILLDENVTKGVRQQKVVCEIYPHSEARKCFVTIAEKIGELPDKFRKKQGTDFLWKDYAKDKVDLMHDL